jgi:hypothetical protein
MKPVIADRKPCSHCGKTKPLDAFNRDRAMKLGRSSWCRVCKRLATDARQQTEAYRIWLTAYLARPDVRERKRESQRRHSERRKAQQRRYRKSPWGQLINGRRQARYRLAHATDEHCRARLRELIGEYDAELQRVRAQGGAPR